MGAIFSFFSSLFGRGTERHPVKSPVKKIINIFQVHYRGIIGGLVTVILLVWFTKRDENDTKTLCVWIWMSVFFLVQPVDIPVTGTIPIFVLPIAGVMSTDSTCLCYFNENLALFILAGMILLMINSCGADRWIILKILCSGKNHHFSGKWIIFKASAAAYLMSMFSSRLIVTSTITEILTPVFKNLQASAGNIKTEPNYDKVRYIVLNSVQTASSIGSSAIIHSAYTTLAMRTIWATHPGKDSEYPDIFNYLQYTCFAFPLTLFMFILVCLYYILFDKYIIKKHMGPKYMTEVKNTLLKHKSALPLRMPMHSMICVFFSLAYLLIVFFRWTAWTGLQGWSEYQKAAEGIPGIKDATVAAIFVFTLHVLPQTFSLLKFLKVKKRSELGTLKPDSSIMWWRFLDAHTNYGYIFLIGAGSALDTAVVHTSLATKLASSCANIVNDDNFSWTLFLVVLASVVIGNAMPGVAACVISMPFVLNMVRKPDSALRASVDAWQKKLYLGSLAVGMGSTYGFTCPFSNSPAYFCNRTGKVPLKNMIKYSIIPILICIVVLWAGLFLYGPIIWDPSKKGAFSVVLGGATTGAPDATTAAPAPAPEL